ncbi:hypothetical protein [Marilutibacter spongiae]|uniref:Uncharacterized protein n=1 Tax=Marilutibacter spongiae TaxID=2025720 RepID=A0A7W3TL75_9GAMM|nr:hypothetical protein [Lysobacter spongiae]MBB1060397.1 hypothetical protein [Lysobacter spongiae]
MRHNAAAHHPTRETARIRWPRNATERAIQAVIFNWHIAGILQELRRGG